MKCLSLIFGLLSLRLSTPLYKKTKIRMDALDLSETFTQTEKAFFSVVTTNEKYTRIIEKYNNLSSVPVIIHDFFNEKVYGRSVNFQQPGQNIPYHNHTHHFYTISTDEFSLQSGMFVHKWDGTVTIAIYQKSSNFVKIDPSVDQPFYERQTTCNFGGDPYDVNLSRLDYVKEEGRQVLRWGFANWNERNKNFWSCLETDTIDSHF